MPFGRSLRAGHRAVVLLAQILRKTRSVLLRMTTSTGLQVIDFTACWYSPTGRAPGEDRARSPHIFTALASVRFGLRKACGSA